MEPWTDQRTPALALVARGNQIEVRSPNEYGVRFQSRPEVTYTVRVARNRWDCNCAFFVGNAGRLSCLHVLAVKLQAELKGGGARLPETGPTCERCRSADVVQAGRRLNRSGPVRRFLCKACGAYFSGKERFHKRRADPDRIAKGLDLYFRGTSFRQVADHFAQAYNLPISPMTVYRWVTHFGKLATEWMDAQGTAVGERWHVDETVVSVNGDKRFVWNVMDAETRFLLATHVSKNRCLADIRAPLRKAKEVADEGPTQIFTDGMSAYPAAILKEFGRRRRPEDAPRDRKSPFGRFAWSPHRQVPSIRAPESNNLVERLHGSEKDRIRPMRGFDTMDGTAALMEGYRTHYNMVRHHIGLGTTPGDAAGLPGLGTFKWRAILDLATTSRKVTLTTERAGTDD